MILAPRTRNLLAWLTVWLTVPSCAWRVAAGFGVDVGFTGQLGELYRGPEFLAYVWVLTIASQAAAFLTFGLVRPWGERVPGWVPGLAGRSIPAGLVVGVAGVGALAVTAVSVVLAFSDSGPLHHPDFPSGTAGTVMALCYAPLLAWGPLVGVLTVAYARRRAHS
ncbi:hypothetical protein [Saccharothrix variisporea]|uniref:Uncharacterized protein n=1 Tax=Saccharothrix variisporea TaxID=543527 RepID=A0A495XBF0_9PSEU|nr:hypothetical protein [Saccharothrix variisporea]RKT69913.1 hypothetical protein DFJ66_3152 [Saccharothrix variisporea]